jgi:hypothetical protein
MAIDRGPWNALVDDDGSNLVGSVWNKAAVKTVLLDPMDGALAKSVLGPVTSIPLDQPAYNNYRPAGGDLRAVWLLNPTIATAVTGFLAEPDGTQHLLINSTANAITLANVHVNSAVGNRFICPGYVNYTLGTWGSVWVIYVTFFSSWIVQKA